MTRQVRWRVAGCAVALAMGLAALGWWSTQAAQSPADTALSAKTVALPTAQAVDSAATQGTVNSALGGKATGADSFLSDRLQQTFEDMMAEANSRGDITDIVRLKQKLASLVPKYFPAELAARAWALLERYVDYRQALGQLAAPTDPADPSAMRAALQARQRVRQQHFTPEEYEALFGEDARLDQFTLARLGVDQQSGLSDAQKRAALEAAEQLLSPAQRAQRAESIVYAGVQAQTAAFDSANTSAPERFAQRSAQFGSQAATRLAQLDAEDRQWQSSLEQYAQARAGFGASTPSAEQALALNQLREKLFTPEQQARVEAGLQLRALNQPAQR